MLNNSITIRPVEDNKKCKQNLKLKFTVTCRPPLIVPTCVAKDTFCDVSNPCSPAAKRSIFCGNGQLIFFTGVVFPRENPLPLFS